MNTTMSTNNQRQYNGWANRQTWNVALWIQNDEGLYHLAKSCRSYGQLIRINAELGQTETPDGVSYSDPALDIEALNEMVRELSD